MTSLSGPSRAPKSGQAPASLIVLLHGRGSNGDDLIGLADMMADHFPSTAFHSPNAPVPIGGWPGYMWYDMDEDRAEGLRKVAPTVNAFIDGLLAEYGLPPSKCALVGFSQGTILSIHIAPRRKDQLAGVVGFSGAMFTGDTLAAEMLSKPPFVLIHGDDDEVLASHETDRAAARLAELGIPVAKHILPGLTHSIDGRGLNLAVDFLDSVLA